MGQAHVSAVGRIGDFAVDARIPTDAIGETGVVDPSAWAGVRWSAIAHDRDGGLGVEPALRLGVPMAADHTSLRLEPAIAIGALAGKWTWAVDVGLRQRLENPDDRAPTPSTHGFLVAGATFDAAQWLRLYGSMDGHVFDQDDWLGRAALGVGGETKGTLFGGLGLRASPWNDAGGVVSGHLVFGVRDEL